MFNGFIGSLVGIDLDMAVDRPIVRMSMLILVLEIVV